MGTITFHGAMMILESFAVLCSIDSLASPLPSRRLKLAMALTPIPYLVFFLNFQSTCVLWDTNMGTSNSFKPLQGYHTWDGHTITFHGAMMILRALRVLCLIDSLASPLPSRRLKLIMALTDTLSWTLFLNFQSTCVLWDTNMEHITQF
jgi:hypothetical protein